MEKISFQEAISIVEMNYRAGAVGFREMEKALEFFSLDWSPVPGLHGFNDVDIFKSIGIEASGNVLVVSWYSYINEVAFLVAGEKLLSMVSGYVEVCSERLFNNGDVLFFLINDQKVVYVHDEGVYAVASGDDLRGAIASLRINCKG
ncbi:hypothetical protein QWZ03_14205 [Chitinimonas viridis]|uniref:SMI1/KNR4 family protein n=1 Tax=Chitinimonas viridis TaxID=664880 RepID=A0ABT8B8G9_9NEIS|nr:hypothetical protein [Chitinimonas viridis]MDN3577921.1 hypothetical protein [Chitinimonas viridis]